jgi:hypothetical protein
MAGMHTPAGLAGMGDSVRFVPAAPYRLRQKAQFHQWIDGAAHRR